jgi:hypothetical protein
MYLKMIESQNISKKKRKTKTTFKLPNVIPEEIDKQFGFSATETKAQEPVESTKITDLKQFNQNITRVDELKNIHNVKISSTLKGVKCCFWDRHEFDSEERVVYCPVEHLQKPKMKNYTSFINGKYYKIQDSIQPEDETTIREYYTDGIFCSIECALAFVKDNAHNPMYTYSENYLRELYSYTGNQIAPHWRLLKKYGGNLSIEEFRKSFINTTYALDGIVFNPVFFLFKENYHL